MKQMMVRYKIKADRVAENEQYIGAVFAQLKREQPPGLHYASFKLADGLSFMHIVSLESDDGNNPLRALTAFQAFSASVRDRCDELPVSTDLQEVGSYQVFG
jgi:hypothetical protein